MALTTEFQPVTGFGHGIRPWLPFQSADSSPFTSRGRYELAFDDPNIVSRLPEPKSPTLASQGRMPDFVQPQDLHSQETDAPSSSPAGPASLPRRKCSIDSTSSSASIRRQQLFRRMSLAAIDLENDSYRPRNMPAKRKKTAVGRITPRSDKHARELELNRKAATKCRNRQKAFIEQLQQKCRREEERLHIQTSLVSALHDEVVALRNEILRQSFCDCRFLSGLSLSTLQ